MAPQSSDSSKLYNVRSDNYFDGLLSGVFMEHQAKEALADVTLSCEGQFIKAHRLILSAGSTYFKIVFETNSSPQLLIFLNDVKYKVLKSIIQFMYTGEVNIPQAEIQAFLDLGKLLEVKGLLFVSVDEDKIDPNATNQGSQDMSSQNSVSCNNAFNKPTNGTANKPKEDTAYKQAGDDACSPKEKGTNKRHQELPENVKKPKLAPPIVDRRKEKIAEACCTGSHQETLQVTKLATAFTMFTEQWRRKLEDEYPTESKKFISFRLTSMWKSLLQEAEDALYDAARKAADNESQQSIQDQEKSKAESQQGRSTLILKELFQ